MGLLRMSTMAIAMLASTACVTLPTDSRSGRTAVVHITEDDLAPRDVTVQPGDEVQFLNSGSASAWIYFSRDRLNELSCQRGFSFFWGVEEVAKLTPGESASVCFSTPGEYGYAVQSQPTVEGGAGLGELNQPVSVPGAILVEAPTLPLTR